MILRCVHSVCKDLFVCSKFQQLIPFMEDDGSKHEERSAGHSRPATEERREILEVNKVPCCISIAQYC